jgi:1-acyl-sn-glycerol-3-phosphate acyltransferase
VAPHTSNWDFVVGLAAMLALGLDVRWLGKNTIFRPPFRALLQWLGGIPVDRRAADDVVEHAVAAFRDRERLFLGLAPEGTRKKVRRWKSGFYRIAQGAGVPILLAALNYRTRAVELGPLFVPTGDYEADLEVMRSRFSKAMARHPALY